VDYGISSLSIVTQVKKCKNPLVALLIYVLTILCCVVRYDFRMKTVFGSSLPPVVCMRGSYLVYVICVYLCVVVSNTCILLYFCFVFRRFVYPMLPFSLGIVHFLLHFRCFLTLI